MTEHDPASPDMSAPPASPDATEPDVFGRTVVDARDPDRRGRAVCRTSPWTRSDDAAGVWVLFDDERSPTWLFADEVRIEPTARELGLTDGAPDDAYRPHDTREHDR